MPEFENPKPSDLVMLAYREIQCDDTLREFIQILRFDLIDILDEPLRAQLLLDRRHKLQKGMSRPVAYFRMSSTEQLIKLANTALAVAIALIYAEQDVIDPSDDQVRAVIKSHWQMAQPDILNAVKTILRDLQLHRKVMEVNVHEKYESLQKDYEKLKNEFAEWRTNKEAKEVAANV